MRRACLIQALLEDPALHATEAGLLVGYKSGASGPQWVRGFNAEGIAGLEEKPRAGRPVTHSDEVRSRVVDLALQEPRSLGLP